MAVTTMSTPTTGMRAVAVVPVQEVLLAGPDVLAPGVQYGIPPLVQVAPGVGVGVVQFLAAVQLALDLGEGRVRPTQEGGELRSAEAGAGGGSGGSS